MNHHPVSIAKFFSPLICLVLCSCAVYPKQESYYDQVCEVQSNRVSIAANLDAIPVWIRSCSDEDCFDALSDAAKVVFFQALVSVGAAAVGNTLYWIDKEANCVASQPGTGLVPRYVIEEDVITAVHTEG